jgi:hypothetical protein
MSTWIGQSDGNARVNRDYLLLNRNAYAKSSKGAEDFTNGWWPNNNAFLGDPATDYGVTVQILEEYDGLFGGEASRVGFVGTTRDQYGTPLGSCVVQLFRTSDDLFIMEITSNSDGSFLLQSWYSPDTHYIVAYKPGSPDVFGTTLNTLVGA